MNYVENNFQEQLNELKIKMSNAFESSSTLPRVVDDRDGRIYNNYHQIQKRANQQPEQPVISTNNTPKPLCANSSRPCSFYYRPDMKKPVMIGKDYCTYFYPDHPDSSVVPLKPTITLENSNKTAVGSGFNRYGSNIGN